MNSGGLPTPVFNVVARIVNHMVSSIMTHEVSVRYTAEGTGLSSVQLDRAARTLSGVVGHRWEKLRMDALIRDALLDAALTGDAVFYSWWDTKAENGCGWHGDYRTVLLDPLCYFPADPYTDDVQAQEYLILSGRCPVEKLRAEAKEAGCGGSDLLEIRPDSDDEYEGEGTCREDGRVRFRPGPKPKAASQPPVSPKATFLLRMWRGEDGLVRFERAVKNRVLRRGCTGSPLYPVAVMHWTPAAHSCHGASPVTPIVGNQKYINKAYAMAMKHMVDTAFSKVIYDRRLIPEWSNEVGQAIGVNAGGDVSNAVKTVGVGELAPNFTGILEQVIRETKHLLGATETAIGESTMANTSAIIALQEASEVPLELVRCRLYRCLEELAAVWCELVRTCYPADRLAAFSEAPDDAAVLRSAMLEAHVDVGAASRYSQIMRVSTLDRLLDNGHITLRQYLERLPDGVITDRDGILSECGGERGGRNEK